MKKVQRPRSNVQGPFDSMTQETKNQAVRDDGSATLDLGLWTLDPARNRQLEIGNRQSSEGS